jgi:hypothetical protein
MIERIFFKSLELAVILRNSFKRDGIEFLTRADYSQQLGFMGHPKGFVIPPHVHNPVARNIEYTNEVLFIKRGKVRIDFYDEEKNYLESVIVSRGDVILLIKGGHGFEVLEDCEIVEVKQGPYAGEGDKTRFVPVQSSDIKVRR